MPGDILIQNEIMQHNKKAGGGGGGGEGGTLAWNRPISQHQESSSPENLNHHFSPGNLYKPFISSIITVCMEVKNLHHFFVMSQNMSFQETFTCLKSAIEILKKV